jgi:hypothetical protein
MRHSTFKTETSARCHSIGDHFTQPGLAFMQVVRLFDPHQLLTFNNFAAIPGADNVNARNEIAAYKLAVREVEHSVTPLDFWFAGKDHFPTLFALVVWYLSVPLM